MVAETISLGILSLPAAVAGLGLVPAIIILIGMGILASYTGFVIGQFKARFSHITSMADAGEVVMGRFGKELLGGGQMLFLLFLMASHVLTFKDAMNTITENGTCSIVFGVVGMVISLLLSLPRTLQKVSWLSLVCKCSPFCAVCTSLTLLAFASIVVAVIVTMVAVGIQDSGTPPQATVDTTLVTGVTSAANIILSYGESSMPAKKSGTNINSQPQCLLHLHGRAKGPERLP